jgi:hypothetical protein
MVQGPLHSTATAEEVMIANAIALVHESGVAVVHAAPEPLHPLFDLHHYLETRYREYERNGVLAHLFDLICVYVDVEKHRAGLGCMDVDMNVFRQQPEVALDTRGSFAVKQIQALEKKAKDFSVKCAAHRKVVDDAVEAYLDDFRSFTESYNIQADTHIDADDGDDLVYFYTTKRKS